MWPVGSATDIGQDWLGSHGGQLKWQRDISVTRGFPLRSVGSAATVESSMEMPQKLKMDLSFDPMLLLLGTYPKVTQSTNCKEHKHLYVHCSVIYNHQDLEATQVSINRWADKTTMGYFHTRILLGCKKEENFTFHNGMDGPREHYAKWNKPVIERHISYDFTHTWNLMNKLNSQVKQTEWRAGWQL